MLHGCQVDSFAVHLLIISLFVHKLLLLLQDDQDSFESTGDYSDSDIDQDAQRQYSRNSRKKHRHRVSDIREPSKENRRFDPNSYDMGRNTKNSNKAGGGSGVKKPRGNP